MSKTEIVLRMNSDRLAKIAFFQSQTDDRQRELAQSRAFWSEHECARYAWQGSCLECGKSVVQLDVPPSALEQGLARDVACF